MYYRPGPPLRYDDFISRHRGKNKLYLFRKMILVNARIISLSGTVSVARAKSSWSFTARRS